MENAFASKNTLRHFYSFPQGKTFLQILMITPRQLGKLLTPAHTSPPLEAAFFFENLSYQQKGTGKLG